MLLGVRRIVATVAMRETKCRWKSLGNVGAILSLAVAVTSHAQSLPAGPGKAAFQRTCSACHSITVVTTRRLNQPGWENVVDNMVSRGAQATPDEIKQIVAYLSANFSAGSPPPAEESSQAASAAGQEPSLPSLDAAQVARAKALIQSGDCLSCHRIRGKGSFAGPYLGDAGASHSTEQLRAALLSPNKELDPQNRSVRLITADGRAVTGKLLNQDGFTVQLIDPSGHLLSFEKQTLRVFTIVTANSMPSYANRLNPADISLLVHYLESLKDTSRP